MAVHSEKPLKNNKTLTEIVRRLTEAFQPERIYLFGSKARGNTRPDSDYDLLIVVPDEASAERKRSRLARVAEFWVMWPG